MLMPGEDDNLIDNFGPHIDKKSVLEGLDIKVDNMDLVFESSNIGSYVKNILSRCTSQIGYLEVSHHHP